MPSMTTLSAWTKTATPSWPPPMSKADVNAAPVTAMAASAVMVAATTVITRWKVKRPLKTVRSLVLHMMHHKTMATE